MGQRQSDGEEMLVVFSPTTFVNKGNTIPPKETTVTDVAESLLFLPIVPEMAAFALQMERAVRKNVLSW